MKIKTRMFLIPILIILGLTVIFALWQYVFTIYEVRIETKPGYLSPDGKSVAVIKTLPVNAFGFKAPFRKSPAHFDVTEGEEIVKILLLDEKDGELKIRAQKQTGIVSILIKPKFSLEPSVVEIAIKGY